MNRTSNLMEGDMASDATAQQTEGGISFPETTQASTNGGPCRDKIETVGKQGKTHFYILGGRDPTHIRGQQTTATHRRTMSAPRLLMHTNTVEQNNMSSLYLAQVDQCHGVKQHVQSSPMRFSSQLFSPARGGRVQEGSIRVQDNQNIQETKDEDPPAEGTQLALRSSPFASRTPDRFSAVADNLVTQKQRSMTLSSEATSSGTKGVRSLSRLEKEIASYNEDSLTEKEMEPELVTKIFEQTGLRRTRGTITTMTSLAKGETPPPPKNLALSNFLPSPEETGEQTPEETDDDSRSSNAVISEDMTLADTELDDTESDEEMDYEDEVEAISRKPTYPSRSASYHQTSSKKSTRAEISLTQSLERTIRGSAVAGVRGGPANSYRPAMQPKNHARRSSSRMKTPLRTTESSFLAPSPADSRTGATGDWDSWELRKDRIREILEAPGYSPVTIGSQMTRAHLQPFQALNDIPDGYSWRMDSDVHVFEPSRSVFEDFETFLKVVEEIAGRNVGVVKVVVPPLMVPHLEEAEGFSDKQLVQTQSFKMSKMRTTPDTTAVYKVNSSRYGFELVDSDVVEYHDKSVSETWNLVQGQENRTRKEASFGTMLKEKSMIDRLTSGYLASIDLDESLELRQSLQIQNLQLSKLPGNRLLKSSSIVPGVHSSKINVCHTEGVPVAMHCNHDATYSINYLHKGAPIYWSIVKPDAHADLEGTVDILTAGVAIPSIGVQKPAFPPECDHFIGHQGLYLPSGTLDKLKLEWKPVVQHENEMLITFPFAYHQGYSTGPNITEEISYASNRWEIFAKEGLYHQCLRSCPVGGSRMDLSFAKASQGRLTGHKRTSTANQIAPSKKSCGERTLMANQVTPSKKSRGDKVDSPASKQTATPRGDTSGRVSKKEAACSTRNAAARLHRNVTPTPNREAREVKEVLDGVQRLFTMFK
ncbi:lysine (K)-specific demethylase [Trapelia coarctata]|nr:lysine (K)-specific demethylase [Trapelia coarctata]